MFPCDFAVAASAVHAWLSLSFSFCVLDVRGVVALFFFGPITMCTAIRQEMVRLHDAHPSLLFPALIICQRSHRVDQGKKDRNTTLLWTRKKKGISFYFLNTGASIMLRVHAQGRGSKKKERSWGRETKGNVQRVPKPGVANAYHERRVDIEPRAYGVAHETHGCCR